MYALFFRVVLARLDPETAHHLAMAVIRVLGIPPFSWLARALTRPDPRLRTRHYGRVFLKSLPPMPLLDERDEALAFAATLAAAPAEASAPEVAARVSA